MTTIISTRPRTGRRTLLWRESDEVWQTTSDPMPLDDAPPRPAPRRRTITQRLRDAWRALIA